MTYTTYNPELPLRAQVKKIAQDRIKLTIGPFTMPESVYFEPLKVNDDVYSLTLTKETDIYTENEEVYIGDKLSFTVKKENGDLVKKGIPVTEIDEFMKKLHHNQLGESQTAGLQM